MASESKVISLLAFKARKSGEPLPQDLVPPPPKLFDKAKSGKKERRGRPRIKYHFAKRPTIFVQDVAYRVINISQNGVKFIAPPTHIPEVDKKVKGSINMGGPTRFDFTATVLRIIGDLVILQFDEPIPHEEFQFELSRVSQNFGD